MMLLWLDSFDRYGTPQLARRYASAPGATILVAAGRRGTSGALVPGAGQDVRLAITGTAALISGCAVQPASSTANSPLMRIRRGGLVQTTLGMTPTGAVFVAGGDLAGPQLGISAAGVLVPGTYAVVAWQILPDPVAGSSTVQINGTTVLSFTNRNTTGSMATAGYDDLGLCGDANGAQRFDDWYVLNVTAPAPNGFLPDVRVDAMPPVSLGAHATWTPSSDTLALWQCVDDEGVPNDDGDFAHTTIPDLADSFPHGPAPLAGATIYGAQVVLVARQALTTPPRVLTLAPLVRPLGVDVLGPGTPLTPSSAAYEYVTARFTPPGGAAQGQAWLSTLELGYTRS
jgi:hypothetical protein